MKSVATFLALLAASPVLGEADAQTTNPVSKVLEMLSDLQAKIIAEGKDAQKAYDEFSEFCEDRSKELGFSIKTGKAEVASLKAVILESTTCVEAAGEKIEKLSSGIATDEADAKAATEIREKEKTNFAAEEEESTGAPDPAVYKGHSRGIIDTLEGLLEDAKGDLDKARKTETKDIHEYELLKQALEDEIKYAGEDLAKAQTGAQECGETKATAEGDLAVTAK